MAHYDMPVFAMASSAGSFSVVTGADASALQSVCKELSVFAEVTVEKEVEVICRMLLLCRTFVRNFPYLRK